MTYEITPRQELLKRIAKFQKKLQENDINGALINQNSDLFYFTGTIQRSILFIPVEGEPVLAVNGNLERAQRESKLKQVVPLNSTSKLAEVFAQFNYYFKGRIGLEMDILPVSYYFSFQKIFKEAEFVDISELIKKTRMIKSAYELERIRKACNIVDDVMNEAKKIIKVGMTELDIDAILSAYTRKQGHMGFFRARAYNQDMNYCHILFGKSGALSTYVKGPLGGEGTTPAIPLGAGFSVVTENLPIIVDYGMGFQGYISDMTRTFVIGKLPVELEKAYDVAREVKYFLENWVKPGKSPSQLYRKIIELVKKRGYQDNFMGYRQNQVPFVGHGIGLEIDEYPVISPGFNEPFAKNMVFSLEPKMAFPGVGAVGLEDDFVVTSTGVERLTNYDDNIIVIKHS